MDSPDDAPTTVAEPEAPPRRVPAVVRWALIALAVIAALALALTFYVVVSADIPEPLILVSGLISNNGLYLVLFGVVGLILAAAAFWTGSRRTGAITGVVALAATVALCFPLVASYNAADDYRTDLSVGSYLEGGDNTGEPVEKLSVTYHRAGGKALKLDAKVPAGKPARPRPAVVWVHGGGWNIGNRGEGPLWHKWLNDKGYAVFAIDYRLAPPAQWNHAPADVKCAVGWVKRHAKRYHVDPDRVVLAGGSAGGNLALMGAYADGRVKPSCNATDTTVVAVAAFYPAVDVTTTYDGTGFASQVRPWARNYLGGTPQQQPARASRASADTYVRPDLPPTLLMHGDRDHVVPYATSEDLARGLARVGVEHQLITVPWGEHLFDYAWNTWGTQISRQVLSRFLEKHAPVS